MVNKPSIKSSNGHLPEGKSPLGNYMHRWKDNIEMCIKERGFNDVD
jgi:hypothetical protein